MTDLEWLESQRFVQIQRWHSREDWSAVIQLSGGLAIHARATGQTLESAIANLRAKVEADA